MDEVVLLFTCRFALFSPGEIILIGSENYGGKVRWKVFGLFRRKMGRSGKHFDLFFALKFYKGKFNFSSFPPKLRNEISQLYEFLNN